MANKLLMSVPFVDQRHETIGRSFYREDIGFGKVEADPKNPNNVTHVWFFDLEGMPTVATLTVQEEPITDLVEEAKGSQAYDIVKSSVEKGLANFTA